MQSIRLFFIEILKIFSLCKTPRDVWHHIPDVLVEFLALLLRVDNEKVGDCREGLSEIRKTKKGALPLWGYVVECLVPDPSPIFLYCTSALLLLAGVVAVGLRKDGSAVTVAVAGLHFLVSAYILVRRHRYPEIMSQAAALYSVSPLLYYAVLPWSANFGPLGVPGNSPALAVANIFISISAVWYAVDIVRKKFSPSEHVIVFGLTIFAAIIGCSFFLDSGLSGQCPSVVKVAVMLGLGTAIILQPGPGDAVHNLLKFGFLIYVFAQLFRLSLIHKGLLGSDDSDIFYVCMPFKYCAAFSDSYARSMNTAKGGGDIDRGQRSSLGSKRENYSIY